MPPDIRQLLAGNWKMNGTSVSLGELRAIAAGIAGLPDTFDTLVCPSATLLERAVTEVQGGRLLIGGQDCHFEREGASTGDVSAEMLADCGARFVIVGHSERRTLHAETDELIRRKAEAGVAAGLVAIVCIGETEEEKLGGRTLDVIERQLRQSLPDTATAATVVVAYEPVWAIGTGLTPTAADVEIVHDFMRARLEDRFATEGRRMRILYGGSVKGNNAAGLMAVRNVDGALVGGASLKAQDFLAIAQAFAQVAGR
ncbi:MAG: triose-phosphate isomerase [Shinella sp.]|uniref:triose-phosphate isomerase n=1 Tax=Shinella sp. TaxID=1870904 RepID=UPI004036D60A